MDRWKYYDIIHQRHSVMNPVNETKLGRLYDLLELKPNARVIDIGCGKGEMPIRLAEKYDIKGLGIDKSPFCVREAEKRKRQRVPQADLRFLEMDGSQYKPEGGEPRTEACLHTCQQPGGLGPNRGASLVHCS